MMWVLAFKVADTFFQENKSLNRFSRNALFLFGERIQNIDTLGSDTFNRELGFSSSYIVLDRCCCLQWVLKHKNRRLNIIHIAHGFCKRAISRSTCLLQKIAIKRFIFFESIATNRILIWISALYNFVVDIVVKTSAFLRIDGFCEIHSNSFPHFTCINNFKVFVAIRCLTNAKDSILEKEHTIKRKTRIKGYTMYKFNSGPRF